MPDVGVSAPLPSSIRIPHPRSPIPGPGSRIPDPEIPSPESRFPGVMHPTALRYRCEAGNEAGRYEER